MVRLEGLGTLKIPNNLTGIRTRDLLACRIVPQPTTTEMSTKNIKIMFLGSKVWPVRWADCLTAICEPIG
jgi:hypothetical protein